MPSVATRIAKVFRFEAAHHLPHHDGKCQRPHGHSYRVEVTFVGEPQTFGPKRGMVIDYGEISHEWSSRVHSLLDHRDLNVAMDGIDETTAELIARWIHRRLSVTFDSIERVRVWETETSWAEWPA